ncbi:MAG: YrhK family protein [Geminicoccaceae bacterium]
MQIFDPESAHKHDRNKKIYAIFELAYTLVDFSAAVLFVVGSILFFNEGTITIGTWCFLIGSIFFGLKPTMRLVRELCYMRAGEYEKMP